MFYAQQINCPVCKAGVPFSNDGVATCPFCLHRFAAPKEINTSMVQNVAVERGIRDCVIQMQRLNTIDANDWKRIVFYSVLYLVPILFSLPSLLHNSAQTKNYSLTPFFLLGFCLIVPLTAVLSTILKKRAATQALAGLRPVTLRIDNGLVAYCPECGANVKASVQSLTALCAHCRTESLLPAGMLGDMLLKKYKAVAALRQKGVFVEKKTTEIDYSKRIGGLLTVIFGIVLGVGLASMYLKNAPEKAGQAVMTACVIGGIIVGLGIWTMRHR